MESLRILIEECPELVAFGAVLCILAGAFTVLAAYTMVCPMGGEEKEYDL